MTRFVDDPRVRTTANWIAALLGFYWFIHRFWPAPFAILCKGAIVGGLYALIALGISLIYRSQRIINFSQADLGGVGASLSVMLIVSSGWPYLLAIPTGLVAGAAMGVLVEFLIIRRFAKAPRLILTVVTIGLGTLLGAGESAMPLAFGLKVPPQNFPSPFNFAFHFQRVVFRGNDLLAVAVVPLMLLALAWFLNRTDFGVAVRASAESSDRVVLLGVPVKRINTLVWAVAALMSTIALILRAGIVGLPVGSAVGLSLLLPTLGAAVLGRMERMPTIVVGAIAFGVVEQAVVWHTGSADIVDLVSFLVIAGALFLQRRGVTSRAGARSSWTSVREVRPIPPELAKLPEVVWSRRGLLAIAAAIAIATPSVVGEAKTDFAILLIVSMIVGLSLLVLSGWTGQISIGQFAFVGIGAVTAAWMSVHWNLDISLQLVLAGFIGAAVAVIVGVPALRIPGLFLMVATFGFAKASSSYFLKYTHFGWIPHQDQRLERTPIFGRIVIESEHRYYFFALVVLLVCIFMVQGLRRSRLGRVLVALRDNERGVEAYGVNVVRAKLTASAFAGFFAAVAGVVLLHMQQALYPGTVSPVQSITAFATAVIGGLGSMTGVFTGAVYLNGLSWIQNMVPRNVQPFLQLLGSGLGLILVLMFVPDGVGSLVFRLRDNLLRRIADRRGIIVPSLVADARVADPGDEIVDVAAESVAEHAHDDLVGDIAVSAYLRRLSAKLGPAGLGPVAVLLGAASFERLGISAVAVLGPNIRDAFHISNGTLVTTTALVSVLPALLSPGAGYLADRFDRVRLARIGALVVAVVGVALGLSPAFWVFAVFSLLAGLGLLINTPTHSSLITDYYPPEALGETFTFYLFATAAIGLVAGPIAGGLGVLVGWRATLVTIAAVSVLAVALLARIKDPGRGASLGISFEREERSSFSEGFRRVAAVRSLRRTWWAAAFFGGGVIAFTSIQNVFFKDVYHYSAFERGATVAVFGLGGLVGTIIGGRLVQKWMTERGADWLPVITGIMVMIFGVGIVALGVMPWALGSVAMLFVLSVGAGGFAPAYQSMIGLVTTPRLRGQAYSYSLIWVTLGAIVVAPIVGGIANEHERAATWVLGVIVIVAGVINFSVRQFVLRDIAEAAKLRDAGDTTALLTIRGLEAAYGNVQILFGVDLDVYEGEIVALLGTNGAGKSTLLRAASGLMDPIGGAVFFGARDVTHADAMTHAVLGMALVPGDRGVFPGLSVAENLRIAAWTFRRNAEQVRVATERVLDYFPVLRERSRTQAGNLSGGEQQMLVLAQALMGEPKLLMIDELSLGLSPIVVAQLLDTVKRLAADGTTVLLVEQSVNVALTVAERAVFMEKGEVRFAGPTAELLDRPDVLRAVFLEGAARGMDASNGTAAKAPAKTRRRSASATRNGTRPVALEVVDVSKRFGGVAANTEVSFELHDGEILGILGPNGAGKTTLFDLISGYFPVDAGHVILDGADVTEFGPDVRARLGLGRSFQDSRLFPGLTVVDTIRVARERQIEVRDPIAAALHLPAVLDDEAAGDLRVDELVDLLGLDAFRNKFTSELSTGTRRMVDLACILAHEPKVILFDEPSSGIAQRECEALGPLLKRIREMTGSSLIVIEHDMPLLTGLADEIVAMELGSVVMRGAPHEVINDPRVVASYLGTNEAATLRSGARKTQKRTRTRTRTRKRVGANK